MIKDAMIGSLPQNEHTDLVKVRHGFKLNYRSSQHAEIFMNQRITATYITEATHCVVLSFNYC